MKLQLFPYNLVFWSKASSAITCAKEERKQPCIYTARHCQDLSASCRYHFKELLVAFLVSLVLFVTQAGSYQSSGRAFSRSARHIVTPQAWIRTSGGAFCRESKHRMVLLTMGRGSPSTSNDRLLLVGESRPRHDKTSTHST